MIISLLTLIAGFEIIYAAVENSILVAGLLSLTNLGLGLVGAWDRLTSRTGPAVLTVGWAAAAWTALSGVVALWLLLGA